MAILPGKTRCSEVRSGVHGSFAALLVLVLLGPLPAVAQTAPVQSRFLPLSLVSGAHANPGSVEQLVWQHPVQIPGAAWLQLRFQAVNLPGASRLEIRSFQDQQVQRLDRRITKDWFPHSAFFNGDALLVRLFAGPGSADVSVALDGVEIGFPPPGGLDSICGPNDDRVLSSDKRVARLEPAGCTAWIGTSRGLIFTAGHCAGKIAQIVEFNVPLSNPDGSKNHPPPEDQYPLVRNLGGISNPNACDWAVYEAGVNSANQTPLQRQGAYFRLATQMPTVPSTLRITGHGMHLNNLSWSQVQKTVTGPYVGMGSGACGPYLVKYQVDSISGDSGSPVIHEGTGEAIAVHSGGDCAGSPGYNAGSAITNADLQRILKAPQPQPGPLKTGDLVLSHTGFSLSPRLNWIDRGAGTLGTLTTLTVGLGAVAMAPGNVDFLVLQADQQDRLLHVTPTGVVTTVADMGSAGSPTGVDLDQDGTYLVSSTDNSLRRITPGGQITTITSLPVTIFDRTNDVAYDPDTGNYIVGIWRHSALYEINAISGLIQHTISMGVGSFYGVDPEPRTGNLVVITYTTPEVRVYDRQGTVIRSWSFPHLSSVKVDDRTGHYHCAGFGHVVEFTPTGAIVQQYGPFAALSFDKVEVYGSRAVTGAGPALPSTAYFVNFRFPDMGGASYRAALAMAQRPGIVFGSNTLNLRQDDLFLASLQGALVQGFVGLLDPAGSATGTISIPATTPRGFTFFCSAVAVQGGRVRLGNTIGITVR